MRWILVIAAALAFIFSYAMLIFTDTPAWAVYILWSIIAFITLCCVVMQIVIAEMAERLRMWRWYR